MPWAGCIIFRQLVPATPPQVALIRSRKRGRQAGRKITEGPTHTLDMLDLELPKGGFEKGKDGSLRDAALREAREELGMTPAQQAPALLTEVGHLSSLGNGGLNDLWVFVYAAGCGEGGVKIGRAPTNMPRPQASSSSSSSSSSSVALSKALSRFLRHNKQARQHNFIDEEGFAPLKQLVKKISFASACVEEDVRRIVENDDKQRFSLREDNNTLYVRCNQGHSIDVPGLALCAFVCPPAGSPPATVVHGTDEKSWGLIQASGGLNRMGRAHIHFAQGLPGATGVISGMRVDCKVLIYIDAAAVLAAGIPLLVSENGVVLCPGHQDSGLLPARFFSRVVVRGVDQLVEEEISKVLPRRRPAGAEAGGNTAETIDFALSDELEAGWFSCDHPQIRADHARYIHRAMSLPAVVSALRREPPSERSLHQGETAAYCMEQDELFCRFSYM